jgi:hypothetical protein
VAKAECLAIDCPRVADAPATLECRVVKLVDLIGPERVLIGEVVGVHLRDDCLVNGRLDPARYNPAARLGYHDYTFVREVRELRRPKDPAPNDARPAARSSMPSASRRWGRWSPRRADADVRRQRRVVAGTVGPDRDHRAQLVLRLQHRLRGLGVAAAGQGPVAETAAPSMRSCSRAGWC